VLYREVMIVYCSSHNGHVNILSEQSAGLSVLNLAIGNNGVNFLRRLDLQGGGDMMTPYVSMLLKSRASLACFQACFFPDRAKDLSEPRYV